MTCTDFNKCKQEMMDQLEKPINENSLYADRIYDEQTASRRCYEKNPITNILEGFSGGSKWETVSKWSSIFLIVCLIIWCLTAIFAPSEEINIGVDSISDLDPATIFRSLESDLNVMKAKLNSKFSKN
jgi:hypothetical protein